LAKEQLELLVAHSYVRHLGDLSGGQILKKLLKENGYPAQALQFYEFPEVTSAEAKTKFRKGLDKVGDQSLSPDAFVAEAKRAFELNGELFYALGKEAALGSPLH